jgi:hypothetical protein
LRRVERVKGKFLEQGKSNAEADHLATIELAKEVKTSTFALRAQIVTVYIEETYRELRLPFQNDPNEKIVFDDFAAWFSYICEETELPASTQSSLKNFMVRLVDPVNKGLLTHSVDDLLALPEGNMQRAAQAAGAIMRDAPLSEALPKLDDLIEQAGSLSRVEFEDYLHEEGHTNTRQLPIDIKRVLLEDGTYLYFIHPMNEKEDAFIRLGLDKRVSYHSVELYDVTYELQGLQKPTMDEDGVIQHDLPILVDLVDTKTRYE